MLLETKKLTKEFTRGRSSFKAVSDVNFAMTKGDIIGLAGRSGSGKTTLLTLLAGLAKPTSGEVVFQGATRLADFTDKRMAAFRSQTLAFVPQGQSLLANLTLIDNVRLPCYLSPAFEETPGRAEYLLSEFGLSGMEESFPAHLSGGEMRRAALARALMNQPEILIADEPTGELDRENMDRIMRLLAKEAAQGMAILFTTHEPEALSYANRIFYMEDGVLTTSRESRA